MGKQQQYAHKCVCIQHAMTHLVIVESTHPPNSSKALEISVVEQKIPEHPQRAGARSNNRKECYELRHYSSFPRGEAGSYNSAKSVAD